MKKQRIKLTIDGIEYDSIKSACIALKYCKDTIKKTYSKYGNSFLSSNLPHKRMKPVTIDGVTYRCERDAERALGLGRGTISYNKMTGRKLNCKNSGKRGTQVIIDGIHYNSLREASRSIHADKVTISKVINKLGTNVLSRIDIPTHGPTQITINGVTYKSISEASKALGIDYNLLVQRIRQGYNGNLTDPKWTKDDRIAKFGKSIKIDDIEFRSLNEASRSIGIRVDTLSNRLKSGWDLEEALFKSVLHNNPGNKSQLIKEKLFT